MLYPYLQQDKENVPIQAKLLKEVEDAIPLEYILGMMMGDCVSCVLKATKAPAVYAFAVEFVASEAWAVGSFLFDSQFSI